MTLLLGELHGQFASECLRCRLGERHYIHGGVSSEPPATIAMYAGKCARCPRSTKPGDAIVRDASGWVHRECLLLGELHGQFASLTRDTRRSEEYLSLEFKSRAAAREHDRGAFLYDEDGDFWREIAGDVGPGHLEGDSAPF